MEQPSEPGTELAVEDTAPERIAEVKGSGFRLIHKPVTPTMLRAVLASVA